jgi:hypothetical protein
VPFTIFPLHGIVRDEGKPSRCACPNPNCTNVGKHPAWKWSTLGIGEEHFGQGCGHGIATGYRSDIFVVDLDSEEANEAFNRMADDAESEVPPTFTVKTARGFHLYFKWPGFAVKTAKNVLGDGIDLRGDGGYVVAAGSEHESGIKYAVCDNSPIADAPAWLLNDPRIRGSIGGEASEGAVIPITPESTEWDKRIAAGVNDCQTWEPHGGTKFFELAERLVRSHELPLDKARELIIEHFQPRAVASDGCTPWPWSEKDIHHKLTQARDKGRYRVGDSAAFELKAPAKPHDNFVAKLQEAAQATIDPLNLDTTPLTDEDLPVDYLVDGILPRGVVGMFVAQPYALKTWAAYSLAIAVSKGKPWLGRYTTKPGVVILVDFEMGKRQLRKRIRMLGGDESILRSIDPAKQLEPDTWSALFDRKPALIIVDSLSAGNRVAEEKDPKFALPLDYAKKLVNACDASVIFIHHTVKDTSGKSKQAWVRGSGAIFGALDFCYSFEVAPTGSQGEKRASVECIKMRQGEEPKPFMIQLTDQRGVELYEDPDAKTALSGALEDLIRLAIGKKGPMTALDLKECTKRGLRQVNAEVARMRANGVLVAIERKLHLDGPKLRYARCVEAVTDPSLSQSEISTPAKLAAYIYADTEDVERWIVERKLLRYPEYELDDPNDDTPDWNPIWFVPKNALSQS